MMQDRALRRRWILGAAVSMILTCISFAWYQVTLSTLLIRVFTSRDIDRALGLLHGEPTFFGPELSGGGVLPGPFAYLILCVPLLKGTDWRLLAYWDIALTTLGAVLLFWFVRRLFGNIAAVFAFALFLSSRHLNAVAKQMVTSVFVISFHVFCLCGLIYVFSVDESKKRSRIWYATCLACALAIQLQMTAIYHAIVALILQLSSRRLRISALTKTELRRGLAIFVLPFLPFLIWLIAVQAGHLPAPRSLEMAGAFLGARVPQFFRSLEKLGMLYPGGSSGADELWVIPHDLWELQFSRNYLFTYLFGISCALTAGALVFRRRSFLAAIQRIRFGNTREERALRVSSIVFILFSAITLPWVIKRLGPFRYMLAFEIAFFLVLPAWLIQLFRIWGRKLSLGVLCLVILVAGGAKLEPLCWIGRWARMIGAAQVALLAALIFGAIPLGVALDLRPGFRARGRWIARAGGLAIAVGFCSVFVAGSYVDRIEAHALYQDDGRRDRARELPAQDLEQAAASIYRRSGWSYEEARRRLFRLGIKHSSDLFVVYQSAARGPRDLSLKPADGYFVFRKMDDDQVSDPKRWLQDQRLPPEVKAGLKNGSLVLGEPEFFHRVGLIPYFVPDPFAFPQFFQNIGYSYDREPEEGALAGLTSLNGSLMLGRQEYLFYWNTCGGSEICRFGLRLKILNRVGNSLEAEVRIFGNALSKSSIWYSPAWTERVIAPSVSIACGGNTDTKLIASSVGYHSSKHTDTFLAPFERKLRFHCEGPLTKLGAGFRNSQVHTSDDLSRRPSRSSGPSEIFYNP